MKYVVSGATGAIGMSLIKLLISNGNQVTVLANPNSTRKERLSQFPTLSILDCPQTNYGILELNGKYDCFVHMAWSGGTNRNDIGVNISSAQASVSAVELASKLGCHTFLSTGSQTEFGPNITTLSESVVCEPTQPFGASKLYSYHLTRHKAKELGIRHFWVRVGSAYGPYDGEQTMLVSTVRKLLSGKEPSFTSGEQNWDFLHSDDIALAFEALVKSDIKGDLFVIGADGSHKLKKYLGVLGSKFNIDIDQYLDRRGGPTSIGLQIDSTKLREAINWSPTINFNIGIDTLIDYCKSK